MRPGDLARLLQSVTSGRRVAVIEPTVDDHDVALSTTGFDVTCLAYSEDAVQVGRRRTRAQAARVEWYRLDSVFEAWPVAGLDAVMDPVQWRPTVDIARRWVWRAGHRSLVPRAPLILFDDAPPGVPTATSATSAVRAALRSAGFVVDDRRPPTLAKPWGAEPVVGWALPTAPNSLAAWSWALERDGVRLDLRYADDEADWLDPPPDEVWTELSTLIGPSGAEIVERYPLSDLYGGLRGAPIVAAYFGVPLSAEQVVFGAGITTLLHDLSALAENALLVAPELVHPDFEAWAVSRGAELKLVPDSPNGAALLQVLATYQPTVIHFDRPGFAGRVLGLTDLRAISASAAGRGATVVVDESAAAYLPPCESAVALIPSTPNLVVLRGFTKGFSWGGLRAGFAVVSHALSGRVRELVAPMQISELALDLALRLLAHGDPFQRLRAKIKSAKPAFAAALSRCGLEVQPSHELIPWVVVADPAGSIDARLAGLGIRGLRPSTPPMLRPPATDVLHLTLPLSPARTVLLHRLLEQDRRDLRKGDAE
jgi:histidinol-phosphate/aromatic aminotransferase/cobyric acid decarboxylase-like protein